MRSDREYVGGIPVVVSLASDDVVRLERPAPAAFVLPRTTMLIAIVPDLLQLFRPYAAALHPESTQVWFSVGDARVSWLYPAGAVKDYVNERTREERLTQLAPSPPPAPAAAPFSSSTSSPTHNTSSFPLSAEVSQPPQQNVLVQSLPSSVASEPLDLTFHIHSITKGSVRSGTVPLYVHYDRLEEHIRMEVKQAHKAAYTCLYGNYTHYQREAESTLLPAIGLALYRPFDEAAQYQLQEQRLQAQGGSSSSSGGVPGSRARYGGSAAALDFTSPFLLLQYQQLLQGVLAPRPHVAFFVRLGFPYAYRGAASQYENGNFQYDGHRVSAAPALASVTTSSSPATPPHSPLTDANTPSERAAADSTLVDSEHLPLGLILWRLFRIPVLRWQQAQQASSVEGDAANLTEAQRTYQQLFQALSAYYADPPACATERLEEQEPLLTGTPPEPPAWGAWESAMAHAFITDYESYGEKVGFAFQETHSAGAELSGAPLGHPQRRIRFEVQGIQPSLATPASFLEAHLSSSDRAIFVTVQV